jgi:hypothetical protein
VRKAIISSLAALAFLAGCEAPKPKPTKWQGPPYRLTSGDQPAKPGSAGPALPPIYFTANPEAVQTRANLAIRINPDDVKKKPANFTDQLLLKPGDIAGKDGKLSDSYLTMADAELGKMLGAYCMNGKVKVKVALVKSSIMMSATDMQVDNHRLSDWLPLEIYFKNPHPRC